MKKIILNVTLLLALVVGFSACSSVVSTSNTFNKNVDQNRSLVKIAVFAFDNYTDTPQAGKRAASLAEGVLSAAGYTTKNLVDHRLVSNEEQRLQAKKSGAKYMLIGGVSEWRYKTGIDGEPAVSLSCKLIDVKNAKTIWSGVASDNDWGNASVGTVAQELLEDILG